MTIERRTSPRYTFIAEVEVTVIATNTTLKARTTDISIDGCFLDMLNPSPKGTDIRVRISHDSNTFEAFGVVVLVISNLGMGIAFANGDRDQKALLQKWISEARS
jgi:PilZ domain